MQWNSYHYERIEDGIRITEYAPVSDEETLRVPSHIEGVPVTEIGEAAFSDHGTFLARIEIPPTVKRIGDEAFRMCLGLTELILHDGLESIGAGALFLTPLTAVALPDTLREIAAPWDLGSIRFTVSADNPCFYSDGFCLFRLPDERASRDADGEDAPAGGMTLLVSLQEDRREAYEIPAGTTVIGESAFSGNESLRRVAVPGTVRAIGEAAFEGCRNLSELSLAEGLRAIGANAFGHCVCLERLHLPATVREIGESALSDTFGWSESFHGIKQITVEAGNPYFSADADALYERTGDGGRSVIKYFGEGVSYRIPEDVTRILPGAFRRAGFSRCAIPARVSSVGKDAFRECRHLTQLLLEESGTALFVPSQPVYRKDEITALLAEERTEGAFLYDYAGYDALFDTYFHLPERVGMACCRLRDPVCLSDAAAETYRAFLRENRSGILEDLARRQDMDALVRLAELGFFTEENIEESLEIVSRRGQTKMTGYLLRYRRDHLAEDLFDYRL